MDQISHNLDDMRALEAGHWKGEARVQKTSMFAALAAALATALVCIWTVWSWLSATRRSNQELITANRNLVQAITERAAGEAKLRHLQKVGPSGSLPAASPTTLTICLLSSSALSALPKDGWKRAIATFKALSTGR